MTIANVAVTKSEYRFHECLGMAEFDDALKLMRSADIDVRCQQFLDPDVGLRNALHNLNRGMGKLREDAQPAGLDEIMRALADARVPWPLYLDNHLNDFIRHTKRFRIAGGDVLAQARLFEAYGITAERVQRSTHGLESVAKDLLTIIELRRTAASSVVTEGVATRKSSDKPRL